LKPHSFVNTQEAFLVAFSGVMPEPH